MHRRIIVAGCCLLIFLAGWAFGENRGLADNGVSWRTLRESEKVMYAGGFREGWRQGVNDGIGL